MAMENGPFEDVFPIENGDFPLLCYFTGAYLDFLVKMVEKCSEIPYIHILYIYHIYIYIPLI